MKHPHPHTTAPLSVPASKPLRSPQPVLPVRAVGFKRVLQWIAAGLHSGADRLAAAAAHAEQRVTDQFKVPPGGG